MPEDVLGQEQFPIDPAAINLIRGREALIDHYGYWPAFIDVEVIRISLERSPTGYAATSNLRAVFYTFDIHKAPDDPLRKQAHTEMLFGEVCDLKLFDWAHQNPIQGLSITRERSELLRCDLFRVFWGGIGHEVNFLCSRISVVDVMDLNPFQKSFGSLQP
jgi:hypothetical protein